MECYLRCVECESEEKNHGGFYSEAAKCMKKINSNKYIELCQKAIDSYCFGQRVSNAAGVAKECAEKLEEDKDYEEAIKFYEKMAELYATDEMPTQANSALVKVADLIILIRDYNQLPKAIKVRMKNGSP